MLTPLGRLAKKRYYVVYTFALVVALCVMSVLGLFDRPDLFFLDRAFNLRGPQELPS